MTKEQYEHLQFVSKSSFDEIYNKYEEQKKWADGANSLLTNYVDILFNKDRTILEYEKTISSLKSEINRLRSIEVTNKNVI